MCEHLNTLIRGRAAIEEYCGELVGDYNLDSVADDIDVMGGFDQISADLLTAILQINDTTSSDYRRDGRTHTTAVVSISIAQSRKISSYCLKTRAKASVTARGIPSLKQRH